MCSLFEAAKQKYVINCLSKGSNNDLETGVEQKSRDRRLGPFSHATQSETFWWGTKIHSKNILLINWNK